MKQSLTKKVLVIAVALGACYGGTVAAGVSEHSTGANNFTTANSRLSTPPAEVDFQSAIDWAALQIYLNHGMWGVVTQASSGNQAAMPLTNLGHGLDYTSNEELLGAHYIAYAYLQSAQDERANEIYSALLSASLTDEQRQHANEYLASLPARAALEQHDWSEAAYLEVPPSKQATGMQPALRAGLLFTKALGAAHMKDLGMAKASMRELNQVYQEAKRNRDRKGKALVEVQMLAAQAWIQQAQGHEQAASDLMEKAVLKEQEMLRLHQYAGLPAPEQLIPMNELQGDLFLEQGQLALAQKAYSSSLTQARNRFNSLYGVAFTAESLGDMAMAEDYYLRLLSQTTASSSKRSTLLHAREFIAQHKGDAITKS